MSVTWQNNPYTTTDAVIENVVVISTADSGVATLYVKGRYSNKTYFVKQVNLIQGENFVSVEFTGNLVDSEYLAVVDYGSTQESSEYLNVVYNISYGAILKNIIASLGRFLENGLGEMADVYSARINDELLNNLQKPIVVFSVSGMSFSSGVELGDLNTIDDVEVMIVGVSNSYAGVYDLYDKILNMSLMYTVYVPSVGELILSHRTVDFDVSTEDEKDIYYFTSIFNFEVLHGN